MPTATGMASPTASRCAPGSDPGDPDSVPADLGGAGIGVRGGGGLGGCALVGMPTEHEGPARTGSGAWVLLALWGIARRRS